MQVNGYAPTKVVPASSDVKNDLTVTVGNTTSKIYSLRNFYVDKRYNTEDTTAGVITKDVPVKLNDTIAYRIAWATYDKYPSDVTTTKVTAVDTLSKGLIIDPSSIQYSDASVPHTFVCNPDPATGAGDTVLTWTFDNLPQGSSGYITYRAKVTDEYVQGGDKVNNHYKMTLDDGKESQNDDQNAPFINLFAKNKFANNLSSAFEVEVGKLVNPVVEKTYNVEAKAKGVTTSSEPTVVGNKIAYKLFWANQDITQSTAVITDKLSKGLDIDKESIVITGTEGVDPVYSGDSATGETVKWTFPDLPAGSSGTITYLAEVTDDVVGLDIVNNDY